MAKSLYIFSDGVYPFSAGGSHRYIYEVASLIDCDVTVVVPRLGNEVEIATPEEHVRDFRKNENFSIVRFQYNAKNKFKKVFSYIYNFNKRINICSKKEKNNINIQYLPALLSIVFSKSFEVTYFFHGPWSMEFFWSLFGRIKRKKIFLRPFYFVSIYVLFPFLFFLEFISLRRAKKIFVASNYMRNILIRYFKLSSNRISVVGAGVNTRTFSNRCRRVSEIPKLVTLRRLEHRMGLELLLDACYLLKKRGIEFELEIGGKGPLFDVLNSKIAKLGLARVVQLVGFVPDEDVPRFLSNADLFVLPSIALEGFGLVILESFACGTPVIAFERGGPQEVLEAVSEEFCVKEVSAQSLAEGIYRLIVDKKFLGEFNYRQIAMSGYRWENVSNQIKVGIFDG